MTWTFQGSAQENTASAGTTTVITHGLSINSGDLLCVYIEANVDAAMSMGAGGTSWTEALDAGVAGETCRHAFYWKEAGGSEPSTYTITHGSATAVGCIMQFRGSGGPVVDAAINVPSKTATKTETMVCEAVSGQTIASGAVSVICGSKDNQGASYTDFYNVTPTNSYIHAESQRDSSAIVMGYRIAASEISGLSSVVFTNANTGPNDFTQSAHISFLEDSGSILPNSPFNKPFNGPFGGPL